MIKKLKNKVYNSTCFVQYVNYIFKMLKNVNMNEGQKTDQFTI